MYCGVAVRQGLTETSIVATFTSAHDIWHGSSGSLVTGYQMRLVGPDGKDVSEYEEAGEVLFRAPNLFVGYLGNAKATNATIDPEGWHSTGDVGLVRVGPSGHEHLFIRDRIKDMIKVKVRLHMRVSVSSCLAVALTRNRRASKSSPSTLSLCSGSTQGLRRRL